jgi:hypothetical protein
MSILFYKRAGIYGEVLAGSTVMQDLFAQALEEKDHEKRRCAQGAQNDWMPAPDTIDLCNPCSFFDTYNMLHVRLDSMGHLGCMLLSLILSKLMTPFQGMH